MIAKSAQDEGYRCDCDSDEWKSKYSRSEIRDFSRLRAYSLEDQKSLFNSVHVPNTRALQAYSIFVKPCLVIPRLTEIVGKRPFLVSASTGILITGEQHLPFIKSAA